MVATKHINGRLGEHGDRSSGFDALGPQHEDQRLAPRLGGVGGFTVHPDDRARGVGAVLVPDFTFEHDVAFAAGVAVGHEGLHFNLGLGLVEHERGLVFALEFAQAHTGAKILPGNVLLKPSVVDVEAEPVGHVVGEDHAMPKAP